MNDRDFGPAESAQADVTREYSANRQANIAAALGVIGGFAAISLLLNLLLGQLFGSF